jgi:ParB family chromosome partitioning protein
LADPAAKHHFMSEEGDIETAMLRLGGAQKKAKGGITGDLDVIVQSVMVSHGRRSTNLRRTR